MKLKRILCASLNLFFVNCFQLFCEQCYGSSCAAIASRKLIFLQIQSDYLFVRCIGGLDILTMPPCNSSTIDRQRNVIHKVSENFRLCEVVILEEL